MIQYAIEGSVQTPEPDWRGLPTSFHGKYSAVCRSMAECDDLVHWFDNRPDFCPDLAVLLVIPNVWPPIAITGMGFATAAELRDCAVSVWGTKSALMEKNGTLHDWDDMRERQGELPREKVAEMAQYAFWDRVKRHKASPITDPFRQFRYPNPTNKTQFRVNGLRGK